MTLRCWLAIVLVGATVPGTSAAQDVTSSVMWEAGRAVLLDPTTYAPAVFTYEAQSADWVTSQILFTHGWFESNPRFTQSGRPNDRPLSYEDGQARIRVSAYQTLMISAFNNFGVGIAERLLVERFPRHRQLIRVLSWTERLAYASLMAYRNAAPHIRQSHGNRRLARQMGYLPQ